MSNGSSKCAALHEEGRWRSEFPGTATLVLLVLALPLPGGLRADAAQDAAEPDSWAYRGITAEQVELRAGRIVQRSRIELSRHGMRVSPLGHGASARILANYDTDQIWLIDRHRRLVHELPISIVESSPSDDEASIPAEIGAEGLFDVEPCVGLVRGDSANDRWRGRRVETTACFDGTGELVALHAFSAEVGIVVRSITADGSVEELRDVVRLDLPETLFLPDPSWRAVDLPGIRQAPATLARYEDP